MFKKLLVLYFGWLLAGIQASAQSLNIQYIYEYFESYSYIEAGVYQGLSVWKPNNPEGWYNLGYIFTNSNTPPTLGTYIVQSPEGTGLLAEPVGWTLIWNDEGSGDPQGGSVWTPVCPDGFVALGSVALHIPNGISITNENFPDIRCVAFSQVKPSVYTGTVWTDQPPLIALYPVSIWSVQDSPFAFGQGTFDSYSGSATFRLNIELKPEQYLEFLKTNANEIKDDEEENIDVNYCVDQVTSITFETEFGPFIGGLTEAGCAFGLSLCDMHDLKGIFDKLSENGIDSATIKLISIQIGSMLGSAVGGLVCEGFPPCAWAGGRAGILVACLSVSKDAFDLMKNATSTLGDFVREGGEIAEDIADEIERTADEVGNAAQNFFDQAEDAINDFKNAIKDIANSVWDTLHKIKECLSNLDFYDCIESWSDS